MFIFYILAALVVIYLVVTNLPVFGRTPSGNRLKTIQALPNYRDGALQNLSVTPMQPEGVSFFKIFRTFFFEKHPHKSPQNALPSVVPDLNGSGSQPEIIWFGHSSYLIKINGYRILVDPVFSKRPSPFSFLGSKAFKGTDFVMARDFKDIDVLVITHDHYDHLDYKSILQINPQCKKIICSLGVASHLERWHIDPAKITELSWNQSVTLFNSISFRAVPGRHFTGRKFKRNQTLWSAFILEAATYKLFLGGDSGYDTHFKEIGENYGPFDIALLECGQYNAYWSHIHMFPEEVVQAATDLQAKVLMPVHWAKFSLAMHPWNESVIRVTAEAARLNVKITTPKLGESVLLDQSYPDTVWWLNEEKK